MDAAIDAWPWKAPSGISQHSAWLEAMLEYVFTRKPPADSSDRSMGLSLENLDDIIDSQLDKAGKVQTVPGEHGRLGHDHVTFDIATNVGAFVLDKERLSLSSESKFNTIRGTCCVYKGKWQYELMLGSKGVMQVGWATYNCKFSQEKGVGDTRDSYAYDGNRIRKWNVDTYKYGQPWLTGDVIGCCIDLDNGRVDFYRNGCWLGEAFGDVRVGPGLAYFPAVSLAYKEQLTANFGATPFRYPVDGFLPLERQPQGKLEKTQTLLGWTKKILPVYQEVLKGATQMAYVTDGIDVFRQGTKAQTLLLAAPVIHRLGPLLMSQHVTETAMLPLLFQLLEETEEDAKNQVSCLLDLLWAVLEPDEMETFLQNITSALHTGFRFSVPTGDFSHHKRYLLLLLALFEHQATRRYLLQSVLFEKIKFPAFMEVKTLDDETLAALIPDVWYELMEEVHPAEEVYKKAPYAASKEKLKAAVSSLEKLQVDVLETLATDEDDDEGQTSREIFLAKLKNFLDDHSPGSKVLIANLCPPNVLLCFFHRLVSLLRRWLPVCEAPNGIHLQEHSLYVHSDYYMHNASPLTRVGELPDLKLPIPDPVSSSNLRSGSFNDSDSLEGSGMAHTNVYSLFDDVVRLYHIGVHGQLVKLSSVKDTMHDYLTAEQGLQRRNIWEQHRQHCCLDTEESDLSHMVTNTKAVLRDALTVQGRHVAWLSATVYSKEKQGDIYWLLQGVLRTLEEASRNGQCLRYLWDHYVEACIKLLTALINHFPPSCTLTSIPGHYNTLVRYSTFLAQHFADPRVVNTDLKDTLLRALAAHVCPPSTVRALECMPTESSMAMIKALLQPYKNRPWAQTNWILMRLWKGCGFAFRYTVAPHLVQRMSSRPVESCVPNHPAPCPSVFFQNHIGQWLEDNADCAATFLGSVLTQLNWAFSQFISMLQEIQNAHTRPERVFIDTRQLKICATCFDLSLGLLRVIEMVVNVAPSVVTSPTRPHWDLLLTRIFQLLSQVLNRITSRSGCFELVVNMDIPGLEGLDHFPVLTAVAGILVALLLKGSLDSREIALSVLLAEPSFQLSTLEFLLGSPATQDETGAAYIPFSLASYAEVKEEEVEQVRQLVALVQSRLPPVVGSPENSDLLCTICYAHPNSVRFVPCGHQSCRYCIVTHLVNNRECFFCKTVIDKVDTTEKQSNV